ncbi:hypothetical protein [Aquamicrobium sp.]|uniref:hypothetical protein n=1 Tax=Aquamicrobium sp. TaxID=1872579 RepID=UPI002587A9C4|nr:hypothetical protein [Aquamicrobium sp.]MCK9549206.1 hypothetical protein [Aquamicrobium sp.]
MPLNRDAGERIEGLSDNFRIAPLAKWRELTGIQVPYQIPGKFRPRTATRPMYEDALETAKKAFADAGALIPVVISESDVLVQEYPADQAVVFVFYRKIAGEDKFVTRRYDLDDRLIGFLKTTGRWEDTTVN